MTVGAESKEGSRKRPRLDLQDSEQLLLCVKYTQEDPNEPRPQAPLGIQRQSMEPGVWATRE